MVEAGETVKIRFRQIGLGRDEHRRGLQRVDVDRDLALDPAYPPFGAQLQLAMDARVVDSLREDEGRNGERDAACRHDQRGQPRRESRFSADSHLNQGS
jgi:hypothetical protein